MKYLEKCTNFWVECIEVVLSQVEFHPPTHLVPVALPELRAKLQGHDIHSYECETDQR